jgi:hypothetical protein
LIFDDGLHRLAQRCERWPIVKGQPLAGVLLTDGNATDIVDGSPVSGLPRFTRS